MTTESKPAGVVVDLDAYRRGAVDRMGRPRDHLDYEDAEALVIISQSGLAGAAAEAAFRRRTGRPSPDKVAYIPALQAKKPHALSAIMRIAGRLLASWSRPKNTAPKPTPVHSAGYPKGGLSHHDRR